MTSTAKELAQAFDWVGIDYLVRQTDDKEQTQITINTDDLPRLVEYIMTGSKHCDQKVRTWEQTTTIGTMTGAGVRQMANVGTV